MVPKKDHRNTFIWLHGFAEHSDTHMELFRSEPEEVASPMTKVVLLEGPFYKIKFHEGHSMQAW